MLTTATRKKREHPKNTEASVMPVSTKCADTSDKTVSLTPIPLFLQRVASSFSPPPFQRRSRKEDDLLKTPVLPKIKVGEPDDEYEQEADRVAETVMRMPETKNTRIVEEDEKPEQKEIVRTKAISPFLCQCLSLDSDEERYDDSGAAKVLQKKSAEGSSSFHHVDGTLLSSLGGSPLPEHVRSKIEPVLGRDLSHVVVHSDSKANQAASSIHAKAFTHRDRIFLGKGEKVNDVGLMSHEAAHVLQQGAANRGTQGRFHAPKQAYSVAKTGNTVIQRKEQFRRVNAEVPQTVSQINATSLSDFQEFTLRQLDWATSPHLTAPAAAADLANFRQVLSFSYEANILETCGDMPVGQIIAAGLPGTFTQLRDYSRGAVSTRSTAWLRHTNNVTQAATWGTDLLSLEGACTAGTLYLIMPPPSPLATPSVFEQLLTTGMTADFINYVTTCSPVLSANNGREIESYLALRAESADPVKYLGRITYVRNFHRFTRPALDGIIANESVTTASQQNFWLRRPLTLVLYSALDHNGAFHRLTGITDLILQSRILTIILEGLGTLGAYETQIAPIAARYGIDGRIDQAMIAGHGSSTGIELAGTATGGTVNSERLESGATSPYRTATENLIDRLVNNMSRDPAQRRIVLYACLTASHNVNPAGIDSTNPATASIQIRNAINADPNIRDFIASRAGARATVLGSQASQWATGFLTPGTLRTPPRLTLQTPHDPYIAAPKIQYVEFGPECVGAVRALVECWAADFATPTPGTACRDAVTRRIGRPPTTNWNEQIIRGIFDIALNRYWTNGNMIARFISIAHWLSDLEHDLENPQGSNLWNNVGSVLPAADISSIFTALALTSAWSGEARIRLIFNQTWMRYDAARQASFLTALGTFTSCGDVRRYLDMSIVRPRINFILPATPMVSPPVQELIIAIMEAIATPLTTPEPTPLPPHIQYLRLLLGNTTNFAASLNISGVASGFTTEDAVLTAIGRSPSRPAPSGAGSSSVGSSLPAANVDLDRDPTNMNDFYLEPFLRTGTVDNCSHLSVRSRPWMARRVDTIPRGHTVHIVGRNRNWYGIEHRGLIRFVYKDFITLTP